MNWVSNVSEARRYQLWRASVKELLLQEPGYRIAIVELGCSLDEPSTRKQSEQYLRCVFNACVHAYAFLHIYVFEVKCRRFTACRHTLRWTHTDAGVIQILTLYIRTHSTLPANQASLIRVNKEYPLCKRYPDQSICLMSSAESALSQIDAFIQRPPSSSPASLPRQCRYFPNSDGPTPALPRADTPGHDEHTRTRGHTRVYSDDIDIDIDLRAEVDRENNNSEHARGKCCDPAPLHGSLGNRIKEKDSEAPAPKKERKGNIDGPTTGGYGSFHNMRDSQSGILPPLDPLSFSFTSVQPLSSSSSPSLPFPCKLTSLQK